MTVSPRPCRSTRARTTCRPWWATSAPSLPKTQRTTACSKVPWGGATAMAWATSLQGCPCSLGKVWVGGPRSQGPQPGSVAVVWHPRARHPLPTGFCQFVRPHHKQEFEGLCLQLTGRGQGPLPVQNLPRGWQAQLTLDTGGEQGLPQEDPQPQTWGEAPGVLVWGPASSSQWGRYGPRAHTQHRGPRALLSLPRWGALHLQSQEACLLVNSPPWAGTSPSTGVTGGLALEDFPLP